MNKWVPIGLVATLMIGTLLYLRFFGRPQTANPASSVTYSQQATNSASSSPTFGITQEARIKALEEGLLILARKISSGNSSATDLGYLIQNPLSQTTEARLKALEIQVADLQKQQIPGVGVTTAPVKKPPLYIPLNSGGSTTDANWFSFDAYQISLDPAEYPGYFTVQLEVVGRLIQDIGTGYVRLYNRTDGIEITSSGASTASDKSVLISSGGFKLASGRKTYQLQAKSDKGIEFYIQNARLKINF